MDDPHSKALDPGLLSSNTLVATEHAQGELVDPGLQHRPQLHLEDGGLVRGGSCAVALSFAHPVGVEQAVRIGRVVVIVSLDQGEERLGHIGPLLWLRGRGPRGGRPL